jgi:hypothetical protein
MTGWSWVVAGYLLTAGTWAGYALWTRPPRRDER